MKKLLLLTVILFGLDAESISELKKACDDGLTSECSRLGHIYYVGLDV